MELLQKLAQRTFENREKMLDAIVQIVGTVTAVSPKRKILNWDDTLDDCINKLYVAVLDAIATLIQYFVQRTDKPSLKQRGEPAISILR